MRRYRPSVDLPVELIARVNACAEANGTSTAELIYSWVITASRLAYRERGHLLPLVPRIHAGVRRAEHGTRGEVHEVRWLQSKENVGRCRELIHGAGSTLPAVLKAAAEAYLAADGDEVAMRWPPEESPGPAIWA